MREAHRHPPPLVRHTHTSKHTLNYVGTHTRKNTHIVLDGHTHTHTHTQGYRDTLCSGRTTLMLATFSSCRKYFIRQQNTQKRKRRASLFDIQQGPGDGTTTFVAQQMSGGSQNGGSDATIATTTTKVKGSNNGTSSSLTKMLKNNGKGLSNDKLNSREEESMRTLADMVLTHDARQQKNNTKQQRQDQNEQQKQQQQQHQQFLREQKEYANGHPIAGQFYGAQSPPQTIPMTGSYYYNPMFAPPHSFMPQHAASPTEMCMFPPLILLNNKT